MSYLRDVPGWATTPQSEPPPGYSAGGYAWKVDALTRLLTLENVRALADPDPFAAIRLVVEVSDAGLAPRGLSPEEFWEREAGGVYSRALLLGELGSAVEIAREVWKYDEESPEALCAVLDDFLDDLSITAEGELTSWRECSRCSGAGQTTGEDPRVDCDGRGAFRPRELREVEADSSVRAPG